jgi:hypothetical protein
VERGSLFGCGGGSWFIVEVSGSSLILGFRFSLVPPMVPHYFHGWYHAQRQEGSGFSFFLDIETYLENCHIKDHELDDCDEDYNELG